MRMTPLATITLLATLAASCRDADATAPSLSAPSLSARSNPAAFARRKEPLAITIPAPNGFVSTVLARGSFVDAIDATFRIKEDRATKVVHVDDPTQMVMARITFAAGAALPWHTHPGPALVTVTAGELTFVDGDDCGVRRYSAGASFMDPGQGHVHVALNTTTAETVVYVTYLDVPVGQSPLVVAPAPEC
jgi:quercetin dioxygenase-like cupin family protein